MKYLFLIIPFLFLPLVGCEDEEVQALSEAQACLDEIPSDVDENGGTSVYDKAKGCGDKLSGYNSVQANSIKCSAYLISGGLDASRFGDIVLALDDGGSDAPMSYVAGLALTKPTTSDGYERFELASSPCASAGSTFYSDVISLVTIATELSQFYSGGFPDDLSSISDSDLEDALTDCVADTDCAETIADTAVDLANDYCEDESAEEDVCEDITAAVGDGTASDEEITEALICLLKGDTEDCI